MHSPINISEDFCSLKFRAQQNKENAMLKSSTKNGKLIDNIIFGPPLPCVNVSRNGVGYILKVDGDPNGITFRELDTLLIRHGFIRSQVDFKQKVGVYHGEWDCPDCRDESQDRIKQPWSATINLLQ